MSTITNGSSNRAPTWFIAHGGPPTLYETNHPAHQHWLKIGSDMRSSNIEGIVFVSAHWQVAPGEIPLPFRDQSNTVLINTDPSNTLVYDFYGFPKQLYEAKFATNNPTWLQDAVKFQLTSQHFHVEPTERGIDHGVWIPLLAAFGPTMEIPLVQISLPQSKDPFHDGLAALRLGRALRGLRDKGIAVIGGGQPVHNLREYFHYKQMGPGATAPYTKTFSEALTQAMSSLNDGGVGKDGDPRRWDAAKALFMRPDYIKAHPTSEHLLPALVALGASYDDEAVKEEFQRNEGTIAWNMYRSI